ncbi:1,4-beta-xylanase [Candidatus Poribacteria bacterium]|nr:1,4-beta-xylanase [Candidatus Poribacteria bacterium]
MSATHPDSVRARIESHRKRHVTLVISQPGGEPLANATVHVQQTRHDLLFGSNIFMWREDASDWQSEYRRRFTDLLNFATIGFYWWAYEPRRGEPRHAYAEAVADWCAERGVVTKGHPLVWNYAAPQWLPDDLAEIRTLSDERVRDCMTRFADSIGIWDVVNEATDPFRSDLNFDNLMSDAWRDYGRVEWTKHCFRIAREANPQATLLINDYRHDAAYERLIEELIDNNGKPLYDAIGIQTHQHGGAIPLDRLWDTCERFSRFGVPLHFTETTFVSGPRSDGGWKTTPDGEARQADDVEAFYSLLFSHPAVEAITWWDFSDLHAWQSAPAGLLREDMSPKPAYERLHSLIQDAWRTSVDVRTDAEGRASLTGFHGTHRATVRGDNGASASCEFAIDRGGPETIALPIQ